MVRALRSGQLVSGVREELVHAARHASSRVELASPFLSRPVAAALAHALAGSTAPRLRMLTALDPRAVAAGALSLQALELLMDVRVEVRTIADLHAKLTLIDDSFALVGSGNLTGKGLGGGPGDNLELGVMLDAAQSAKASKLFSSWWRVGHRVGATELRACAKAAARIKIPPSLPPASGPSLGPGSGQAVQRAARRGRTGFWLKMLYHQDGDPHRWTRNDWISSAHNFNAGGDPSRRPSFEAGDLLVVYSVGTGRCPDILEVTGPTTFDPGRVRQEAANPEDADRWGWVTPVAGLHRQRLTRAPTLEVIGVAPAAVRQKGHIVLSREQYGRAYRAITGRRLSASQLAPLNAKAPQSRGFPRRAREDSNL
ncbi:MAG: hypothetical protein JWQ18_2561 [Conexibacter sp.]|nr:hypothetical protein [Conexibacter sp.]